MPARPARNTFAMAMLFAFPREALSETAASQHFQPHGSLEAHVPLFDTGSKTLPRPWSRVSLGFEAGSNALTAKARVSIEQAPESAEPKPFTPRLDEAWGSMGSPERVRLIVGRIPFRDHKWIAPETVQHLLVEPAPLDGVTLERGWSWSPENALTLSATFAPPFTGGLAARAHLAPFDISFAYRGERNAVFQIDQVQKPGTISQVPRAAHHQEWEISLRVATANAVSESYVKGDHIGTYRLLDESALAEGRRVTGDRDPTMSDEKPTYTAGTVTRIRLDEGPAPATSLILAVAGKSTSAFFKGTRAEKALRQSSAGWLRVSAGLGWSDETIQLEGSIFLDRSSDPRFPFRDQVDELGQPKLVPLHGGVLFSAQCSF